MNFNLSDKEKQEILEKHKQATKQHYQKVEDTKKGLTKPEADKPVEKKTKK